MPNNKPIPVPDVFTTVLAYDRESGECRWSVATGRGKKPGDKAGNLNERGYLMIKINGKLYAAHRLIYAHINGVDPGGEFVDHIDGNKQNNRPLNLRLAGKTGNQRNSRKPRTNSSGIKGVSWVGFLNKWKAQCYHDGKNNYLGIFAEKSAAEMEVKRFRTEKHGQFAHHG